MRRRRRRLKRRDVVHGDYATGGLRAPGARLLYASADRKLSPVEMRPHAGRPRPVPVGPYCSATYVSIEATCPDTCRFKAGACYITAGFTALMARQLDESADSGDATIRGEADLLDRAFGGGRVPQDGARGGRDLRLHVGGDVADMFSIAALTWAVDDWKLRGGGAVWTYTHRWREIERVEWGTISVLASCETVADAELAVSRGYVPALVVDAFPSERAFRLSGLSLRFIPCPAETRGTTCVECRLCFDDAKLQERGMAIAFALHGLGASKVRLPVLEAG